MNWELDHVFFATDDPVACESALSAAGFEFGHRLVHHGQGTTNACAFFDNVYFEILREDDADDLRSDVVRPLCLEERIHWRDSGACPFGLCFRPGEGGSVADWPTETWPYEARNRPLEESLPIVTPRNSPEEPMVFLSRNSKPAWKGRHSGVLTKVTLRLPFDVDISAGIAWCAENLFSLVRGDACLMELEWDNGGASEGVRFGQALPLLVRR